MKKIISSIQKSLLSQNYFSSYLIPILLLVCSFVIYSYNLEGQPWHGDEWIFNAGGIVYFDLIKKGDLLHPCWSGIGKCDELNHYSWEWPYHSGHVRHVLIGFGRDLAGADEGNPFAWSHFWDKGERKDFGIIKKSGEDWKVEGENMTLSDLAAGRLLSPVFGSLTVMLAFFLGKMLFNRLTGLTFSLILLFYGLWILFSRLAMTEVFVNFFILLTLILLIYSFKEKTLVNYKFFIFSAIVFGISLNTKFTSIELAFLLATIILFRKSFNNKLNFHLLKNKKEILKTFFLVFIFSIITISTVFLSNPYYYPDPINQLLDFSEADKEFGLLNIPSLENNNIFRTFSTFHTILIPYLINYYDEPFGERPYHLTWDTPQTYSTIPLSLFFFVGIYFLVNKINKRNLTFAELLLLVWFTSLFLLTILTVSWVHIERYFIPIMFSLIFISAYGLSNFLERIKNKKDRIIFFVLFLVSHSVYALSFWEKIYLSPYYYWNSQMVGQAMITTTIQNSIQDPLVYLLTIALLIFFIINCFKIRKIGHENDRIIKH